MNTNARSIAVSSGRYYLLICILVLVAFAFYLRISLMSQGREMLSEYLITAIRSNVELVEKERVRDFADAVLAVTGSDYLRLMGNSLDIEVGSKSQGQFCVQDRIDKKNLSISVCRKLKFDYSVLLILTLAFLFVAAMGLQYFKQIEQGLIGSIRKIVRPLSADANDGGHSLVALKEEIREVTNTYHKVISIRADLERETMRFETMRQISHDLRSPLGTLRLELRRIGSDTSLALEAIERISTIANEAINYDISFPPIQEPQEINVVLLIEEVRRSLIEKYGDFEMVLDLSSYAEQKSAGMLSEVSWYRIFSNLISNSLEARKVGMTNLIKVTLSSNESGLLVEILDRGIGIPEKHLNLLGSKKFTYGKPEGTGVGLTSVYSLVHSAHGHIEIESEQGTFTKVKMMFPRA